MGRLHLMRPSLGLRVDHVVVAFGRVFAHGIVRD